MIESLSLGGKKSESAKNANSADFSKKVARAE
jgi:hypothetical protein